MSAVDLPDGFGDVELPLQGFPRTPAVDPDYGDGWTLLAILSANWFVAVVENPLQSRKLATAVLCHICGVAAACTCCHKASVLTPRLHTSAPFSRTFGKDAIPRIKQRLS